MSGFRDVVARVELVPGHSSTAKSGGFIALKSIAYKDFAASIRSKTNLENYFFSYRERREIPIVIPDFAGSFAIAQRYQQSTAIDGWEGELLAPNLTSAFVLTGQRKF